MCVGGKSVSRMYVHNFFFFLLLLYTLCKTDYKIIIEYYEEETTHGEKCYVKC